MDCRGIGSARLMAAFCADLTATQAAHVLGLNRNTVNRYFRLFRECHQDGLRDHFSGTVEVDESWFGAARPRGTLGPRRKGRGSNKQPRLRHHRARRARLHRSHTGHKEKDLQNLIRGKVAPEATVISDGWQAYSGLVDVGHDRHLRITKHRKEGNPFTDGEVHINGTESFWSFTKRRLAKSQRHYRNLRAPPQGMRVEMGQGLPCSARRTRQITSPEPFR